VYAFEPEAMNYGRLTQNMELNPDLADRVFPLPFALWDRHELLNLHMANAAPGAAEHVIGNGAKMDDRPYRQTIFTVRLDDLETWGIPLPSHVKIDVDSYEANVLRGAGYMLAAPTLKTVMVEVDHRIKENASAVMTLMKSGDFIEKGSWHRGSPDVTNHLFGRPE
jgi:FkbM family methyltransferase